MFVFIFCLLDFLCTIPYPNGMQLLVYIFMLGCNPNEAYTRVNNWLRIYVHMILLSLIVCFRYFNTRLNFASYSLALFVTLLHRKNMAGSMLGLTLFATHSFFSTMECRMSVYFLSSLVELSYMFCRPFFAGYDIFVLNSSPNKSIYSSM